MREHKDYIREHQDGDAEEGSARYSFGQLATELWRVSLALPPSWLGRGCLFAKKSNCASVLSYHVCDGPLDRNVSVSPDIILRQSKVRVSDV